MGQPYGGRDPGARDPRHRDDAGGQTGGSPRDLYGQPVAPQLYPPLGYASDGTPLFRPGQPTNTELTMAERAERAEGERIATAEREADDADGRAGSRVLGVPTATLVLTSGMVVLLVVAFVGFLGLRQGAEEPLADSPLTTDTMPIPRTFEPPSLTPPEPGQQLPGQPGERIDPQNKPVTYEATIDGQATILYVDDAGLRSEFAPTNPWTVQFTGGINPLRLLVIAGTGSAVTCSITVDGEVVVEDTVTPSSTRRTASCIA
ncbi:hypothetical protein [Gordonia sp. KTR9]|uniref:hypothetical protein n=1 Tax=Gordonia sp. KTR9 TaxID=337191 RepID=UPI00027DDA3B|nr:hypothetical protein [Gordonia sp. KTR9]AFR46959.1 hypothetical protein KTR9_0293 [Gordonia sp. KTR9]